jgi:hypothetical protein
MLLLSACSVLDTPETVFPTYVTEDETTAETTEATVPADTTPPHSMLYLDGYTPEQIIEYFNEVVLNVEYTDGTGDATLVQKWLNPIFYGVYGDPTQEDLDALYNLFDRLNALSGFPGIYAADDQNPENLSISFFSPDVFRDEFSSVVNGEDAYGATQFWYYTDTNELYHGRIGHRTDIPQAERSSIIAEEIINTLGITDTVLREDSIVYQYSNENLTLSDIDWVILKLLYDPAIESGMDKDACEQIIKQLYY